MRRTIRWRSGTKRTTSVVPLTWHAMPWPSAIFSQRAPREVRWSLPATIDTRLPWPWSRPGPEGNAVALPPNTQNSASRVLQHQPNIRAFLHDTDAADGTDVRRLMSKEPAPRRRVELPEIHGGRHIVSLFTSGTTGTPKTWKKTADQLLGEATMLGLGPCAGIRRIVATVPAIHIYGLLFGIAVPLLHGGAFARLTPFHAPTIAATLERLKADTLVSVPAHLRALELLEPSALPRVLRVFSSGAALPAATAEMLIARFGVRVTEILGSSETGGIASRQGGTGAWTPLSGVHVSAAPDGQMLVESPFATSLARTKAPARAAAMRGSHRDAGRRHVPPSGPPRQRRQSRKQTSRPRRPPAGSPGAARRGGRGRLRRGDAGPAWSANRRRCRRADMDAFQPFVRHLLSALRSGSSCRGRSPASQAFPATGRARFHASACSRSYGATSRPRTAREPSSSRMRPRPEQPGTFDVHVPPELAHFDGHFDGDAILAGVVQVEVLVSRQIEAMWTELVCVRKITRLRFRRPIRPGDDLVLQLERPEPARVDFEIRCGLTACSSGTLHFEV